MKKTLLIIALIAFSLGMFAQSAISGSESLISSKSNLRAEPFVTVTIDAITTTSITASFVRNAECASYVIILGDIVNMMPNPENYIGMFGIPCYSDTTYIWSALDPNTEYAIFLMPKNALGETFPLQADTCKTLNIGGTGLSELTVSVSDITATEARTIIIPNAETSSYRYGLMTVSYYNEIGADSAVNHFKADPYIFYQTNNWVWSSLSPATDYNVIAIGQNINDEWGTAYVVPFTTLLETGISETENQSTNAFVFPNPNNGKFNINPCSSEVSELEIFDLNGRIVYKQNINTISQQINVEHLDNGYYFVQLTSSSGVRSNVQKIVILK
ncbi:MAG: T9SS type A sorting domain-containing protein [Bacteroidales bacterium]|nr:T9SS type A sorting domain-containing protein [Bacteroidales bacterium]MDY0215485.1 T9SS type A sorting domain-containing protein [Bacteroidales bacterium]